MTALGIDERDAATEEPNFSCGAEGVLVKPLNIRSRWDKGNGGLDLARADCAPRTRREL